MENAINHTYEITWRIELETAIVNGQNRRRAAEIEAAQKHEAEQFDRKQKWGLHMQKVREALPEILRPLFKDIMDLNNDPVQSSYEEIVVDSEKFGLAPIEVDMRLVPGGEQYQIHQYLIFGIAQVWRSDPPKYFFAVGDENYDRMPEIETDLELALARAAEVYQAKCNLELTAKSQMPSGDPEYIDTGEDIPSTVVTDQALLASIRAIVRDEMFNPPTTK